MAEQRDFEMILEKLGFSKESLEKRIKIYDNAAKCLAKVACRNWSQNIDVIVGGSRGEGMSSSLHNDLDVIMVQPAVKCYHVSSTANNDKTKYISTFEVVERDVPKGYVKLRLSHKEDDNVSKCYHGLSCTINRSLTNEKYLKNDAIFISAIEKDGEGLKKEGWLSDNYDHHKANGPSQPLRYPLPFKDIYLSIDYVQAFTCEFPSFLDEWCERVKMKTWPCSVTIEEIRTTTLFVVPVGCPGSTDEYLQWRLSYTLAEKRLVRSFSDAQIKAYAAMKMLVKQEMNSVCKTITSYMIKNVMFWVSEDVKEMDNFCLILCGAIKKLKECINSERLPNYFIPSRNLLQGKPVQNEREKMIYALNKMCLEGVKVLQRCPAIAKMYSPSGEGIERALRFRTLSNEVVMAFFAIGPDDFAKIEHILHQAKTSDAFQELFLKHVLPIIRERNLNECFPLITSMNNEDVKIVLNKGFTEGFHEIWCN